MVTGVNIKHLWVHLFSTILKLGVIFINIYLFKDAPFRGLFRHPYLEKTEG